MKKAMSLRNRYMTHSLATSLSSLATSLSCSPYANEPLLKVNRALNYNICNSFSGVTLVVSPLVSLMEDQLLSLQQFKVEASLLNASSTKADVNRVHTGREAIIEIDQVLSSIKYSTTSTACHVEDVNTNYFL